MKPNYNLKDVTICLFRLPSLLLAFLISLSSFAQEGLSPAQDGTAAVPFRAAASGGNEFGYSAVPDTTSSSSSPYGVLNGSFAVSPSGAATYSIPIESPEGVGGMDPEISIVYNSQAGNGICGYGTNISGISVITCGMKTIYHDGAVKGIKHDGADAYFLDGRRMVLSSGSEGTPGAVYILEDDPFTSVTVKGTWTASADERYFQVNASNGITYEFGNSDASRQQYTNSAGQKHVNSWYVSHAEDASGNYIIYSYTKHGNTLYPLSVSYGKNKNQSSGYSCRLSFEYEPRTDVHPYMIEDVRCKMAKRLKSIATYGNSRLYRRYEFNYTSGGYSLLDNICCYNLNHDNYDFINIEWYPQSEHLMQMQDIDFTFEEGTQLSSFDINGDGLFDIVKLYTEEDYILGLVIKIAYYLAEKDASGNISFSKKDEIPFLRSSSLTKFPSFSYGMQSCDFNGDGKGDYVVGVETPNNSIQIAIYYGGESMDLKTRTVIDYFYKGKNGCAGFLSEDLDNDGSTELIILEDGKTEGSYYLSFFKKNPSNLETTCKSVKLSLNSVPKKVFLNDYNNDGLKDLCVISSEGYQLFFNKGKSQFSEIFSTTCDFSGTNISDCVILREGDFNGDGMVDFIMSFSNNINWYFAFNNGDGTFTKSLAYSGDLYHQNTPDEKNRFQYIVFDCDGDGKSDVFAVKPMFVVPGFSDFSETRAIWLRSTGEKLIEFKRASSVKFSDADVNKYIAGDFNGDGLIDIINYGFDCYNGNQENTAPLLHLYTNVSNTRNSNKIRYIDNSNLIKTKINYSYLTSPAVYTHLSDSLKNTISPTIPLSVVSEVSYLGADNTWHPTYYNYSGLRLHLQGKGLLGFTSTKATDTVNGSVTTSNIEQWSTHSYLPSIISTIQTIGEETSTTRSWYGTTWKKGKSFYTYLSQIEETDFDGNVSKIGYEYDTGKGVCTSEYHNKGTNMYRRILYGNYIWKGNRWLPQTVTVKQRHKDHGSEYVDVTSLSYDNSGRVTKRMEHYGDPLQLTTEMTYDAWGNILSEKASGFGVSPLTKNYYYDADGRFVIRVNTTPASAVTTYTYDTFGRVLTESDKTVWSSPITTTYTYDGWGRRIYTINADGTRHKTTYGWGNTDSNECRYVLEQGDGTAWKKTWYDRLGRETKTESIGAKDVPYTKKTTYDGKGLPVKIVETNGSQTVTVTYTYDARKRLLSEHSSAGKSTAYSYGNRSVTTTTAGRSYTKTYDAWGNIASSSDPVSSVSYCYHSNGKPKKVTSESSTFRIEYDGVGNQTQLTDPDAGTITYEYDALGRVIAQEDARGISTSNSYDQLGRLTLTTTDGIDTEYTYGTSGNEKLRLIKERRGDCTISYEHDGLGRITSEMRSIGNSAIARYKYTYNSLGQVAEKSFNGLKMSYGYDSYGNAVSLSKDGRQLWQLTANTGRRSEEKILGKFSLKDYCDNAGRLCNRHVLNGETMLHVVDYEYDNATDNVTSRWGTGGKYEFFTYDGLDRLTRIETSSSKTGTKATTMQLAYSADGNISSKTGVGNFTYDATKKHAVTRVDNTEGLMPSTVQNITYDCFGKAERIEHVDGKTLTITYGPDGQRWKSVLTNAQGSIEKTTFYGGDVESALTDREERIWYYLADNILCMSEALRAQPATPIFNGNGMSESIQTMGDTAVPDIPAEPITLDPYSYYMVVTDAQGSVLRIVGENGNTVFLSTYDAWGNQKVMTNTIGFYRGYTGHEMLPEFGLINMNGRLYDPLLGRMLSPDNYVQMPDFSQNFNRYSYCLNNPLKYTDPSGELFGSILTAIVGVFKNIFKHGINVSAYNWDQLVNAWKIDMGMFKGNITQVVNKWTYGFVNSVLGNLIANGANLLGLVDNVSYLDGAVAVGGVTGDKTSAFTIGHYIMGPDNFRADWRDHLFVHEYGHYIQSQYLGPLYVKTIGIPSIISCKIYKRGNHTQQWFEVWANKLSASYFDENYGSGVEGYKYNDKNYFDIDKFINGGNTPYKNPRTGDHSQKSNYNSYVKKRYFFHLLPFLI